MIKLINKTTKTPMWVADDRKNEYLEAGHKPASNYAKKPVEGVKVEVAEAKSKVKEVEKTLKKK